MLASAALEGPLQQKHSKSWVTGILEGASGGASSSSCQEMEARGAPRGRRRRQPSLCWFSWYFLSILACGWCLCGGAWTAGAASTPAVPNDTAEIRPAAAAVAVVEAASAWAAALSLPAKVPLTVVRARVALRVKVGGQELLLGLDSCKEGLRLFASGSSACSSQQLQHRQAQHPRREHLGDAPESQAGREPLGQQEEGHTSPGSKQQLHQQRKCYDSGRSSSCLWCLNMNEVCTAFSETPFTCRASKRRDQKFAAR